MELELSPHVHARRLDAFSLAGTELRSEKLIEGFLFATLFLELALILFDFAGHRNQRMGDGTSLIAGSALLMWIPRKS